MMSVNQVCGPVLVMLGLCAGPAAAQVVGTVIDAELTFQPTAVTIAENAGGGHYSYGAEIGTGDIRVHAIDTATGELELLDAFPGGGLQPVDLATSGDGRFLVVCNLFSETLTVQEIGADGGLTPVGLPTPTATSPTAVAVTSSDFVVATHGSGDIKVWQLDADGALQATDTLFVGGALADVEAGSRNLVVALDLLGQVYQYHVDDLGTLELVDQAAVSFGGQALAVCGTDVAVTLPAGVQRYRMGSTGLLDQGLTPGPSYFDAEFTRGGRLLVCVTFGGDTTDLYRASAPALELLESVTVGPGSSVPQTVAALSAGSTEFVLVNRHETNEVVSLGFTQD